MAASVITSSAVSLVTMLNVFPAHPSLGLAIAASIRLNISIILNFSFSLEKMNCANSDQNESISISLVISDAFVFFPLLSFLTRILLN